jgi:hypothetical protein
LIIKNESKYFVEESKKGRFYCRKVDGEVIKYPSVTTVISQSEGSKFSGSPSASIGSLVHFHITKKYSKKLLKMPTDRVWNIPREEVQARINRCLTMWNNLNLNIKPIVVETALFCDTPRVAGRLDIFCKIDNDLTLLDIKTGKQYFDHHVMQGAIYQHMLRRKPQVLFVYLDGILERNPEQKAVLRYFTQSELQKGYDEFLDRYATFKW